MNRHPIRRLGGSLCFALSVASCGLVHAAPSIELWTQPGALGIGYATAMPVADLAAVGLRDRIGSVVVREGRWQLCERPQFAEPCIGLGPGRHGAEVLPRTVASVRPMDEGIAPVAVGDGPALRLFRDAGFGGRALDVETTIANLADRGFNDEASSVEIRRGRWQLCTDADFRGDCAVLGPGRHALDGRFQDSVSSLRRVVGSRDEPLPRPNAVILHEDGDFNGRELVVVEAQRTLREAGFNDRASSLEVLGGRWQLCTDADYAGQCITLQPGRYRLLPPFQDRISSLRPY